MMKLNKLVEGISKLISIIANLKQFRMKKLLFFFIVVR